MGRDEVALSPSGDDGLVHLTEPRRRLNGQQPTAQGEFVLAVAIGEEAVMADTMESVRQRMKKEATNELVGVEGHDL